MGNSSSLENVEPDPWWQLQQQQSQRNSHNMLQQPLHAESEAITSNTLSLESIGPRGDISLQSTWHRREQTLGQTIQHLAEENMRISSARQAAEKRLQEVEVETLNSAEELDKLRSEAKKSQEVLEKLHAQIQSGREDRQMITSEMERIRTGFDAERTANEQLMSEMRRMKEEHEQIKRSVEFLNEQLKQKTLLVEKTMVSFNQERKEKECITKELEKLREELMTTKASLATITDVARAQDVSEQQRLQAKGNYTTEESTASRIRNPEALAEMERFQAEMSSRREARQRVMQAVSAEMERLRAELNAEREARQQATQQLKETLLKEATNGKTKLEEALTSELEHAQQKMLSDKKRIKQISQENSRLQFELDNGRQVLAEKTDDLEKMQIQFDSEREQTKNQIVALKEVSNICKEMLNIRENQILHLKRKLKEIEASVTNTVHDKLSVELKTEYETQIENIRSLKSLYEERMKLMLSEKEKLVQDSEEKSQLLDAEIKKSAEFEQQLADMKLSLEEKEEENSSLQIQLDDSHDKSHGLAKELTLINNLFTQMLIGNTATDMDLDRLTRLLQENHDLITDITIKEDSSEVAAALPKLLLDLVNQVDSGTASTSSTPTGERNDETSSEIETELGSEACANAEIPAADESSVTHNKTLHEESINGIAVQDIALNLPKVWKVLMELLSHHVPPSSTGDKEEKKNSCYKSVDTPSGPRLVISVSQTFLRLKDLILEKKSLRKELIHLKQLNGHLERKLNDQENKLSMVSTELKKTWNVVDQMQTQHQKLHTHEKILRYELHEKRKMLNELKQELEYCREKWERARQKNSESEEEWKKLRREFASRKKHPNDILNNSGESGFLDERGDDSCEDEDSSAKDTGQLDPGIEELSLSENIRTSSPLETDYPEPNLLINPSRVNMSSCIENTEHIISEPSSELILNLDSESLPSNECSVTEGNDNQNTFNMEPQLQATELCLNSYDSLQHSPEYEYLPDCRIDSPTTSCTTISIITQLKQQLAFFSKNLDYISTSANDMTGENLQALESIFSLPPIQIPTKLNNTTTDQSCFEDYNEQEDVHNINAFSMPSTSNTVTSVFDGRTSDTKTSDPLLAQNETSDMALKSADTITESTATEEQCADNFVQHEETASSHTTETAQSQSKRGNRTAEEIAEARAERLKSLEEQCQQLYNKVTRTTHRSNALYNRLEELHEQFRGNESPPGSRNVLTRSPISSIPGTPPLTPSALTPVTAPSTSASPSPLPRSYSDSSVRRRCKSQKTSDTNTVPIPPPLPRDLPTLRIPLCCEVPQTTGSIPVPPPLPHVLPSRRIPTYMETVQTSTIPTPPPFPQNLRGTRLLTCMEMLSTALVLEDSINETTRQTSTDVQSREELSQNSDSTNSSSENHEH